MNTSHLLLGMSIGFDEGGECYNTVCSFVDRVKNTNGGR